MAIRHAVRACRHLSEWREGTGVNDVLMFRKSSLPPAFQLQLHTALTHIVLQQYFLSPRKGTRAVARFASHSHGDQPPGLDKARVLCWTLIPGLLLHCGHGRQRGGNGELDGVQHAVSKLQVESFQAPSNQNPRKDQACEDFPKESSQVCV